MKKNIFLLVLFCSSFLVFADDSTSILRKGNNYFSNKKYDEALVQYNKVIEIDPNYAEAHANIGGVYREKGKMEKAKQAFLKAHKLYELQNKQEKKIATEKLINSMNLVLKNRRNAGYLLIIFIPLCIFGLIKMKKKGIKLSQTDDVKGFLLVTISLFMHHFSPFFQRLSFAWWLRVIILAGGFIGGVFFISKGLYKHYRLKKRNNL